VRHPLTGVWILPQQHNADAFIWRQLQRGENLVFSGIDLQRKSPAFVIDELRQAFEVRFVEFRADYRSP
jgi:flagellar biosynthesis protein FliP